METNRAVRRHHAKRLKTNRGKRDRITSYIRNESGAIIEWRTIRSFDEANENRHRIGLYVHTACLCSCPKCGNPRKHRGERSLREESDLELFELELKELA